GKAAPCPYGNALFDLDTCRIRHSKAMGIFISICSEMSNSQVFEGPLWGANEERDHAMEAGRQFLAAKAKEPGVVTTGSGLQYKVVREGTGRKPSAYGEVEVHYKGSLIDGRVFDSSYDRGEPISFLLAQVIPGWAEGVQLMHEGAHYTFYIPFELGYGAQGIPGDIPPYSTLVFEVELLKVYS
ncbi:MAG: FKBP-type peptidyl-prolyl cis-trans isomerase, partial [Anaerolineae bacterium]|nr:FKBP-type peptidyl-prolyl cis-trans isomerase [Anaerolineae bacterium]